MVNITIQNLEVESAALNQVSPGEMEKVVGGYFFDNHNFTETIQYYILANVALVLGDLFFEVIAIAE